LFEDVHCHPEAVESWILSASTNKKTCKRHELQLIRQMRRQTAAGTNYIGAEKPFTELGK